MRKNPIEVYAECGAGWYVGLFLPLDTISYFCRYSCHSETLLIDRIVDVFRRVSSLLLPLGCRCTTTDLSFKVS
jgi:hypothetical protein